MNMKTNYHIRVVETAWSCDFSEIGFVVSVESYYATHTVPRVIDIIEVAPNVAVLCYLNVVWLQSIQHKRLSSPNIQVCKQNQHL